MRTRSHSWVLPLVLLTGAACATGYGPMGLKGGYAEVPLDANTFRVEFRGNGYTSRHRVETFLHFRCAEIALQAGYDWFVVLGADTEAKRGSYTTPGQYTGQTSATGTTIGNTTWVQGTSTGTYTPGQTYYWTKYGASAVIKAFRGSKPADLPVLGFDAHEVLRYLGPYVKKNYRTAQIPTSRAIVPAASKPATPAPPPFSVPTGLKVGMSFAEVEGLLGAPKWRTSFQSTTRWDYAEVIVIFEDGHSARFLPPQQSSAPRLEPDELFRRVSPAIVVIHTDRVFSQSQGSGVVIGPERVITNAHVLDMGVRAYVSQGKTVHSAFAVRAHPLEDLAELRVPGLSAPAVTATRSASSLRPGERVYAIGAPLSLELTISEGLISGIRERAGYVVVQTTAAISPGSSGGGLFDEAGNLVGITTFKLRGGENMNFALPTDLFASLRPLAAIETAFARPRVRYKSPLATMKADLLRGQLVLFYNPAKWKPTPSDDPNKMTFQHANGDGYAMIIAERLQIPLPKLKEVAVINARQAAPNVRVTLEEPIRVNGVDVLGMQMEGTIQGIDFIYYGYYYSGPQGSIQLLTYTGRNLFPEFKADFEEFLNGFQPPGR